MYISIQMIVNKQWFILLIAYRLYDFVLFFVATELGSLITFTTFHI